MFRIGNDMLKFLVKRPWGQNVSLLQNLEVISIITETAPYSFGNFRKLSLYNCFMPI